MGRSLPILGLLGSDVLEGQSIELDYAQSVLRLDHPGPEHADGRVDPVWNILVGHARLGRSRDPIMVLVDTGSARTIVNRPLARWARRRHVAIRMRVGGASRLSRMVETEGYVRLDRFQTAGLCLPPFLALEADVDIFRALGWEHQPAIIVGMDLLEHATLRIDHANDVFELSPASEIGECSTRRRIQIPNES